MAVNRALVLSIAFACFVTFYSLSELSSVTNLEQQQSRLEFENRRTGSSQSQQQASSAKPLGAVAQQAASPKAVVVSSPKQQAATDSSGSSTSLTFRERADGKKCYAYPNTELWGDVLVWGNNHKVDSVEECCDKCRSYKPPTADDYDCNVWVYCGNENSCHGSHRECWLKHLAHPEAAKPAKQGPHVPWLAGTVDVDLEAKPASGSKKELRKFHIVTSAQGTAVHWQIRIHYYWYKKQKHKCEQDGPCEMGGFTRLLHSGHADDLMDEIPTMVVDPLPKDMVDNSWYVVLNRPYAFAQWVKKANIPEKYVLMAEPDHVFIRPLPNFMTSEAPAAFPFFYIEPAKAEYQKITMKFTGQLSKKQLAELAPIGNSPTYMTFEDMKTVMPLWMNTSIAVFKDPDANKAWGWVQEMYGFCIALWLGGIKHVDLYLHLMSQPPWDKEMEMAPGKPFHIIHYTYGMDYTLEGIFTPGKIGQWRFDKRSYSSHPLPRNLAEPPKGMQNDLVRTLISSFNEATAAIPCWNQYAETGAVPKTCDEKPGGYLAIEAEEKAKKEASSR